MIGLKKIVWTLFLSLALVACGTTPRISANAILQEAAKPTGYDNVRVWADEDAATILADQRFSKFQRASPSQEPLNWLAISGGAQDGAFGAGFLVGLSEQGKLPKFSIVSGVSTGALIAPFIFLGPNYNPNLIDSYTNVTLTDIATPTTFLGLSGSSVYDTAPLQKRIASYVNDSFLQEIAAEHRKGRLLLVVTTNLDAQRGVIWNMGEIASSGKPNAVDLFRSVLLASASIPAVFPPVSIKAEANGKQFDELHVDGGTTAQVMTVPMSLLQSVVPTKRPLNMYIVVNGRLSPEFSITESEAIKIAERSLATILKAHMQATLQSIESFARRNSFGFYLTSIGDDFSLVAKERFDNNYMRELFAYGKNKAHSAKPWAKTPDRELQVDASAK